MPKQRSAMQVPGPRRHERIIQKLKPEPELECKPAKIDRCASCPRKFRDWTEITEWNCKDFMLNVKKLQGI